MTTPRKIFAAVALAAVAMFGTAGLALAGPNHVDDGGHHGGHSNSHADNYHFGDDNDCNYKYRHASGVRKTMALLIIQLSLKFASSHY